MLVRPVMVVQANSSMKTLHFNDPGDDGGLAGTDGRKPGRCGGCCKAAIRDRIATAYRFDRLPVLT